MKLIYKSLLTTALFLTFFAPSFAQDTISESNWRVNADIVSNYIWRGVPGSTFLTGGNQTLLGPHIQPTLAFKTGNFEIGAWGSTDLVGSYKEVDLYVTYATDNFSFTVYDYFWSDWTTKKYFNYDTKTTSHIYEVTATIKIPETPISLTTGAFVYGDDKKWDSKLGYDPVNDIYYGDFDREKQNYSSYFEIGYSLNNADLFVGVTPSDGYYGDYYGKQGGFAFVNVGINAYKKIKLSDKIEIPIKASLIANPQADKIFLVFSITL